MRQKPFKGENAYIYGEMAEWSKAHDWKSCVRHKRTMGSNPIFSAKQKGRFLPAFFVCEK